MKQRNRLTRGDEVGASAAVMSIGLDPDHNEFV